MALITGPKITSISGNSGTLSGQISYAEGSGVSITPATDKMTFAVTAAAGTTLIRSNTNTSTLQWGATAPYDNTAKDIFFLPHGLGSGTPYIFEGFMVLTGIPSATPDFILKATLLDASSVDKHKSSTFGAYCVQGANANGITAVDGFNADFTKLETYGGGDNIIFFQGAFEVNSGINVYLRISGKQATATNSTTLNAYNAVINVYRVG